MRAAAISLSGVVVALAGAFWRTCVSDVPAEIAGAVCGAGTLEAHPHCAGCALIVAGLLAAGLAPALAVSRRQRRTA